MFLIDTDPGIDDAHALAMAFSGLPPEQLIITTVAGNVGIDVVTENARRLVGALAPGVAVHRGAAGPILGASVEAPHIHGDDGMGGFAWPDAPLAPEAATGAVRAILDAADRYGEQLTIVALGPLTNVALAIRIDPSLPERIGRVVSMGGTPAGWGNASINAEFNVFADPIAAEIVYSTVPLTLITWDLTQQVRFSPAELDSFWAGDSDAAGILRGIHEHRKASDPAIARMPDFGRVDPLAMAIALDETVLVDAVRHPVVVGYGGLGHGVTAVDWKDERSLRPRLTIPTRIDRKRAIELFTV
ncbi:nucleoside hydrolase [Microbacterium esteraromaticum]|nr:nucleoside hydrolase [Microbacterium esteraromaticum]